MTKKRLTIISATLFLILSISANGLAQYKFFDLDQPYIRKIPMAIPAFRSFSNNNAEERIGRRSVDLITENLEFTGYFKMIDPRAFLYEPKTFDITGNNINFRNWAAIGAEYLITGGILVEGSYIELELRMFDILKKNILFGKKYTGKTGDLPKIIRRFCSEIIYHLTGRWGVFDTRIAFISDGTGEKEIYICDFDGKNVKQFTSNKHITLFPSWSSDGKWMAYTAYTRGRPDIYIRNIKDKHGTIVSKKGINSTPVWRPGKFELAATLSFEGDQDIYLLNGNGNIIRNLTNSWGIDTSPTWSPDGKKIAFVSNRYGNPHLFILDIESGKPERLTYEGKYNTQPDWSPRGDRIAYSSMEKGRINIKIIDPVKKKPIQLTRGNGSNESPTWSSDGSMIAFSSTREGPSRIYVMTAFGTDQRRLLKMTGQQTQPNWSPRIENY